MPSDFLNTIVAHKRKLIESKRAYFATVKKNVDLAEQSRYRVFKRALSVKGQMNLIAEIKKASPSQGTIRENFDVMELARAYVEAGASAISVLTEEKFFLGSTAYLKQVSDGFDVPTLTKDFILDEGQIYEAFCHGAGAVLLIVAMLTDDELKHLLEVAARLDCDALVEVHDAEELDRALKAGADIIGINNRNLHTFEVSLDVSRSLIPMIPKDRVIVAESGIRTHEDVICLRELGADAVLIGETFLRAADVGAKVKEVMYGTS